MANIHAFLDDLNPINDRLDGLGTGFQGTIKISDTKTEPGVYIPIEAGTYTNAGGLIYAPEGEDEGFLVQFIYDGTNWVKNRVEINVKTDKDEHTEIANSWLGSGVGKDYLFDTDNNRLISGKIRWSEGVYGDVDVTYDSQDRLKTIRVNRPDSEGRYIEYEVIYSFGEIKELKITYSGY